MKKNLFGWLAMATMLVGTGCSSDEVVNDYSPENAIQFGTYVGKNADGRASIVDVDVIGNDGFGVFAYYTNQTPWANYSEKDTPNFMNNTQVTKQGSEWHYSPLKYWPNNDDAMVTFFAYAPWQNGTSDSQIVLNNTEAKLDFTVENNVKDQVDLIWSSSNYVDANKQTVDGEVEFVFKHALSRIGFTVQAAVNQVAPGGSIDEHTVITLNRIVLGTNTNGFFETGTLDLNAATATWTNQEGEQSFELNATNGNFIQNSNVLTSASNTQVLLMDKDVDGEDDFLMIIPENMEDLSVYIEYTVATDAGNADESVITNTITRTINEINFVAGNAYTLNLVLGMTSVKISATVESWNEQTGNQVDLPLNLN